MGGTTTDLDTLNKTVKAALPSGTYLSAFMSGQCAGVFPTGNSTSYLEIYAGRLHQLVMAFHYNTLEADATSTAAARAILTKKSKWWFAQNTIKSTAKRPQDGSRGPMPGHHRHLVPDRDGHALDRHRRALEDARNRLLQRLLQHLRRHRGPDPGPAGAGAVDLGEASAFPTPVL